MSVHAPILLDFSTTGLSLLPLHSQKVGKVNFSWHLLPFFPAPLWCFLSLSQHPVHRLWHDATEPPTGTPEWNPGSELCCGPYHKIFSGLDVSGFASFCPFQISAGLRAWLTIFNANWRHTAPQPRSQPHWINRARYFLAYLKLSSTVWQCPIMWLGSQGLHPILPVPIASLG